MTKEIITLLVVIIPAILGSPFLIMWYKNYLQRKNKYKLINKRIQNDNTIIDRLYKVLYESKASRAFIYQLHPESNPMFMSCAYEVVKTGISKEINNLQGMLLSEWNDFLMVVKNDGLILIEDVEKLEDLPLKALLKNKGVKTACGNAIFDKYGSLKGFIGIDYINDTNIITEEIQQMLAEQANYLQKYLGEYQQCAKF